MSAGVLADRMAATLVHHEPGWRLPRLTALARRYNVSVAEVDAAIDELAGRHLLRRLPDGQVYRASPAEYRVLLEGLAGLTSHVDPMGGQLVCKSRNVSKRRPPEDIGRTLGLEPGESVLAIRCLWTVGGEPAALSASYLPERLDGVLTPAGAASVPAGPGPGAAGDRAGAPADEPDAGFAAWEGPPAGDAEPARLEPTEAGAGQPRALQIELVPPPPSVARSLRLNAGELVATVTVSFEDPAAHQPVALTTAMLRPELFRIVVQGTTAGVAAGSLDGFVSAWTQTVQGWEP